MPAPKQEKKKGAKGTCGAIILYMTNALLLLVGIAGSALSALVMVGDSISISGLESAREAIAAFVPETFVLIALIASGSVTLIAILGFIGTCCQRKENKLAMEQKENGDDATVGGGLGGQGCCSKDACMSCGMDLYIVFCFVGLIVLIVASAIGAIAFAGVTPAEVESFINGTCGEGCSATVTGAYTALFNGINNFVVSQVDTDGWQKVQNAFGCCGWWNQTNATTGTTYISAISAVKEARCCINASATLDQTSITYEQLSFQIGAQTCGQESGISYTCGARIVSFAQANMQNLSIGVWVFTFVTLVCFVSALVIRCAIKPTKKRKVEPESGV